MAVAPDGSAVFVTGRSPSAAGTADYATVAYSASTGGRLWASRYVGERGAGGDAVAVAADPAGKAVFVTGSSPGRGTGADYVTIAYDAGTGRRLWLRRYNGPAGGNDDPSAIAVSADGSDVFVAGTSQGGPAAGSDFATVAYAAATGTELWASRYGGRGGARNVAASLAISPDGAAVYVTGSSGSGYATVAYAAAGGQQRWATVGPSGRASSIGVSRHQVFVTGTSGDAFGTVAYEAGNGSRRWFVRYEGGGSGREATSMVVGSYDLWVTGSVGGEFATIRYGTGAGFQRWASIVRSPAGGGSRARQMVIGCFGGTMYVTGGAGGSFVTVAYRAYNGSHTWLRTHPGMGMALAVSPVSGDLIVTGTSSRSASGGNYITFAYHGPRAHQMRCPVD